MPRTIVNKSTSGVIDGTTDEWDLSNDWEDDVEVEQWTKVSPGNKSDTSRRPRRSSMPFHSLPSKRGGPIAKYLDEDNDIFKVSSHGTRSFGNGTNRSSSRRRHTVTVAPKVQHIPKSMSSKLYEEQIKPIGSFGHSSCPTLNYVHEASPTSNDSPPSTSGRNERKMTIRIKKNQWGTTQQAVPRSPQRMIKPSFSASATPSKSKTAFRVWQDATQYDQRESLSERTSRSVLSAPTISPPSSPERQVKRSSTKRTEIPSRWSLQDSDNDVVPPVPPAFAVIASSTPNNKKPKRRSSGKAGSKKSQVTQRSAPHSQKTISITPDGFPVQIDDAQRGVTSAKTIASSPARSNDKLPAWALLREQRASTSSELQHQTNNKSRASVESTEIQSQDMSDERSMQSSIVGSCYEGVTTAIPVTPDRKEARPPPPDFSPSFFKSRSRAKSFDSGERLSWSLKPTENFSDWKIVVRTRTTGSDKSKKTISKKITYHVHRNVVGVGSRKSSYFLKAFKNSSKSVGSSTLIELGSSAALAFPTMLDYMYGFNSSEALDVSTHTAVALRYLGDLFGVLSMFKDVNNFIQDDMNVENVHIYLKDALQFEDERLIDAILSFAARELKGLTSEENGGGAAGGGSSKGGKYSKFMDLLTPKQQLDLFRRAMGKAEF